MGTASDRDRRRRHSATTTRCGSLYRQCPIHPGAGRPWHGSRCTRRLVRPRRQARHGRPRTQCPRVHPVTGERCLDRGQRIHRAMLSSHGRTRIRVRNDRHGHRRRDGRKRSRYPARRRTVPRSGNRCRRGRHGRHPGGSECHVRDRSLNRSTMPGCDSPDIVRRCGLCEHRPVRGNRCTRLTYSGTSGLHGNRHRLVPGVHRSAGNL